MANPIERAVRRIDSYQQTHSRAGFVFGVIKKYGDDRGGSLAALLTYYAFLSLFPALLLLVTALGFVLHNNAHLQQRVLSSALGEFPIIGDQIRTNIHSLRAHGVAIVIGIAGLLWGTLGVTQATQHAMAQVWNVPGVDRPGFVTRVVKGLAALGVIVLGVAVTSVLAALGTKAGSVGAVRVASTMMTALVNVGLFMLAFHVLTPDRISRRALVPGAMTAGLGWTVLQLGGTYLVGHQLRHASQVYGFFAVVLGLISWLSLAAQLTLYSAEINVVLARRLWPRSIVQPPLTPADRVVLTDIAGQERRRPEQDVDVRFPRFRRRDSARQ